MPLRLPFTVSVPAGTSSSWYMRERWGRGGDVMHSDLSQKRYSSIMNLFLSYLLTMCGTFITKLNVVRLQYCNRNGRGYENV